MQKKRWYLLLIISIVLIGCSKGELQEKVNQSNESHYNEFDEQGIGSGEGSIADEELNIPVNMQGKSQEEIANAYVQQVVEQKKKEQAAKKNVPLEQWCNEGEDIELFTGLGMAETMSATQYQSFIAEGVTEFHGTEYCKMQFTDVKGNQGTFYANKINPTDWWVTETKDGHYGEAHFIDNKAVSYTIDGKKII